MANDSDEYVCVYVSTCVFAMVRQSIDLDLNV
jgi:hypothetical protein